MKIQILTFKKTKQNCIAQMSQSVEHEIVKTNKQGFLGGAVVENLPANAGDTGSGPGLGGSHTPRSN